MMQRKSPFSLAGRWGQGTGCVFGDCLPLPQQGVNLPVPFAGGGR